MPQSSNCSILILVATICLMFILYLWITRIKVDAVMVMDALTYTKWADAASIRSNIENTQSSGWASDWQIAKILRKLVRDGVVESRTHDVVNLERTRITAVTEYKLPKGI